MSRFITFFEYIEENGLIPEEKEEEETEQLKTGIQGFTPLKDVPMGY